MFKIYQRPIIEDFPARIVIINRITVMPEVFANSFERQEYVPPCEDRIEASLDKPAAPGEPVAGVKTMRRWDFFKDSMLAAVGGALGSCTATRPKQPAQPADVNGRIGGRIDLEFVCHMDKSLAYRLKSAAT